MNCNRPRSDFDGQGFALAAPSLTRRAALARVAALPLVAALPAALAACNRGPKCDDTRGLSEEDTKIRSEIAAYVEQSPDPTKRCDACLQFGVGGDKGCGTCKVVKGPINPGGTCKLFVVKPV